MATRSSAAAKVPVPRHLSTWRIAVRGQPCCKDSEASNALTPGVGNGALLECVDEDLGDVAVCESAKSCCPTSAVVIEVDNVGRAAIREAFAEYVRQAVRSDLP